MDLKQLEYFVNVVDLGGFSRAARLLGVAQPAISRQVRSLEVELRQNLLAAQRPRREPDRGRQAAARACPRDPAAGRSRARRGRRDQGRAGRPRRRRAAAHAGAPDHRADRARVSAALSARVAVDRRGIVVATCTSGCRSGASTSACSTIRCRRRRSTAGRSSQEPLCFVAPSGRARHRARFPLRDLPRYPLIIPSRPNAIRMLVETRLAAIGLKPQVAMEIDAVSAILELVAEGHGDAVLSPRALDGADIARRLVSRDDRASPPCDARCRSPRPPSDHRRRCSRRRSP